MIALVNANTLRLPLADKSVHMICTSPPYWGLRSYQGTGDAQLGLERLHDCQGWATGEPCGECYVCHTVAWARECWRVLRDDGVMWLNLGDSYASGSGGYDDKYKGAFVGREDIKEKVFKGTRPDYKLTGLKPKDLCLIPSRVALALQADGWYVRSNPPWLKRNPMPESSTDRPGTSHEDIFLLTKIRKVFFDMEAVRVGMNEITLHRLESPTDGYGKRSQMFAKQGLVGNHLNGKEFTI